MRKTIVSLAVLLALGLEFMGCPTKDGGGEITLKVRGSIYL